MRLAWLTHQFPGIHAGGIGTYTDQVACALARAGHDVHVITAQAVDSEAAIAAPSYLLHAAGEPAEALGDDPAQAAALAMAMQGGLGMYHLAVAVSLCRKMRELHEAEPFDLVEAPDYQALGLPLMIDPPADLPIVTHLHSSRAVIRHYNDQATGEEDRLIDEVESAAIQLADARCAPSSAVTQATSAVLTPVDAALIPLPVNLPEARSEWKEGGPVLYVGRLERVKGADLLGGAANSLLRADPTITLGIVGGDTLTAPGGGSMQQFIIKQIDPALRDRVVFHGELPREQVIDAMRRARLVVLPSRYESFGYTAAEAMACGRPVVCRDGTAVAQLVGPAGVAVKKEDSRAWGEVMAELCHDVGRLQELGKVAVARVAERLSSKQVVDRRVAFYQQVIDRFRQRGRAATIRPDHRAAGSDITSLLRQVSELAEMPMRQRDKLKRTPGVRLAELADTLREQSGRPVELWLFGAGRFTARLMTERYWWERNGHRVVGLVDDHPRFARSGRCLGLPVCSRDELVRRIRRGERIDALILSTDSHGSRFEDLAAPFRDHGICVLNLAA
jgi:glycosyltransferase involved in cell wall biosynthesis